MTDRVRLTNADERPLRLLCRPGNGSYEASVHIALEAEGIAAIYRNTAGFRDTPQVFVAEDDYDRAKQVISGLQNTSNLDEPEAPVFRRIRWVAGTIIGLMVLRGMWNIFSR